MTGPKKYMSLNVKEMSRLSRATGIGVLKLVETTYLEQQKP